MPERRRRESHLSMVVAPRVEGERTSQSESVSVSESVSESESGDPSRFSQVVRGFL